MGSTVLFQNIECLLFGFGSRLCRILTLFCSLRVRFRNETFISASIPDGYALLYLFYARRHAATTTACGQCYVAVHRRDCKLTTLSPPSVRLGGPRRFAPLLSNSGTSVAGKF